MEIVANPKYGSVEHYAQQIRDAARFIRTDHDVLVYVTGIISGTVDSLFGTDAEKVEHVRNALSAGELVRAEMQAVR